MCWTLEHPCRLLSVFGGKITTYRRLAEAAMAKLACCFPGMGGAWTAGTPLPGGDFPWDQIDEVRSDLARRFLFLTDSTCERLIRAYGMAAVELLGDARSVADMGRVFGADLTEREIDWQIRTEWARCAEDVLWRRSKLGLRFTAAETAALDAWLGERPLAFSSGS